MHDNALSSDVRIRMDLSDPARTVSVDGDVERLLGFLPAAFLRGEVSLASLIHHGDRDIADTLFANPLVAPDLLRGTFNIRLRHADGRIRCVRGEYARSVSADGVTGVDVLLQDAKRLWHSQGDQTMMASFKAMMDNTDDFIFFKDRNHVFTGASQTLVALTAPVEHWTELIGKTDYDVFPEAYADVYYALEKQVFSGVAVAHEVQEILRKDGSKGWVDNRKYPIHDDAGAIIGLFGIARDISALNNLTRGLEAQQQFSRSLIENLPGIFYLYAYPENRLVLWNKRHEDLLGYSAAEMKDRHILDWHLPENREATLAAVEEVMSKGAATIEAPLLAKDGRQIYFSLNGVRFDTHDKTYLMGVGTDITEHRKTEEALRVSEEWHRLLADSVSDVIWTMDLSGQLTYVSPSVEKLRGFTVEEVMHQSMEDYLTADSLATARTELGRFIGTIAAGLRPPDFRCELEQRCKDGATVWTEITASVMFDAKGKFVSGQCATYSFYMSSGTDVFSSLLANDPNAEVAVMGSTASGTVADGFTAHYYEYPSYGMIMGINANATAEERAATYMFLDWMSQPDNLKYLQYGEEGKTYNVVDGINVYNTDYTGDDKLSNNNNKDYWCLVQEVQHYGDEAADLQANKTTLAPAGYDWVVQDAYDLQKKGESGGIITPIFSKAVQATTEYSADLNSLWQEAYVDCVTCSPDEFESKYEEYCQEYLDAGYQEILDEKASLIADGNVLVVK